MERIKYLFVAILLCGALIACDSKEDSLILKKSNIEIKAKLKTLKSGEKAGSSSELVTVFTGDNIVSYNGKTGEIILKDVKESDEQPIFKKFGGKLEFYKAGELLFKLKSEVVTDYANPMYNTPVLYYSRYDDNKLMDKWKFYIVDGYPWGLPISQYEQSKSKERMENVEKMLSGWNIFVETLKKEGKYVE